MARDIHKKPFSQETITKLEVFEAYLREWLPVFIQSPYYNAVNICDYFAGTGQDSCGVLGSPLRIVKVIEEYKDSIIEKKFRVGLLFNELSKKKYDEMKVSVQAKIDALNINGFLTVEYCNEDFQALFQKKANGVKDHPNLIFLDQNGIKQISHQIFGTLDSFNKTDFMFFIASSFITRFGQTKEFKEHFPDFDASGLKNPSDIHRKIVDYYRSKLPQYSKTRLFPFTIKKDQNIYGLVFGTKHVLGAEKFLKIAWDKNKINGEANFDIDDDTEKQQGVLFDDMKIKTKLEKFKDDLQNYLNNGGCRSNKELYDFALDNGVLPSHVSDLIQKMKQDNIITYQGHAKISYDKCYKNPETVNFEAVK